MIALKYSVVKICLYLYQKTRYGYLLLKMGTEERI